MNEYALGKRDISRLLRMLLQVDGSWHDWLEEQGPRLTDSAFYLKDHRTVNHENTIT